MIVTCFGIIHFGLCWAVIEPPSQMVNYIKRRALRGHGMIGIVFLSDRSRHPG